MYSWLFFKIYDYFKSRNNDDSVFNASLLVFFAQIVHVTVLLLSFSKIFSFDMPRFSTDNATNKLFIIPIVALWSVFVHIFYKRKVKKQELSNNINPIKLYQLILLIFVVIFIPLYIGIRLSGGQIWK